MESCTRAAEKQVRNGNAQVKKVRNDRNASEPVLMDVPTSLENSGHLGPCLETHHLWKKGQLQTS